MANSEIVHCIDLLRRLPREIRDLIYSQVVEHESAIYPNSDDLPPQLSPFISSPDLLTEATESFFTHNVFETDFCQLGRFLNVCPWDQFLHPKNFLRQLIVKADEHVITNIDCDSE